MNYKAIEIKSEDKLYSIFLLDNDRIDVWITKNDIVTNVMPVPYLVKWFDGRAVVESEIVNEIEELVLEIDKCKKIGANTVCVRGTSFYIGC